MERETNIWHLVMEHSVALFIIGSLVICGMLFLAGILIGRYSERKRKRNQ